MSTRTVSFGEDVQITYSESASKIVSRSANWSKTAGNTIQGLAVSFSTYNGGYVVDNILDTNGHTTGERRNTIGAGEMVTIPLPSTFWQGSSGTVTVRFKRPGERQGYYTDIVMVITEEPEAQKSTAVVPEAEAGQPQTVAITNSSDTVQHQVTWSYEGGEVVHGPILYGAATRYPSWAVPAEDLPGLYAEATDRAYITGTVTVKTLTADGTDLGSVSCDARLRIPDSAGPTLTVSSQTVHDSIAQAVNAGSQTEILVQHHTSLTITPTAEGLYGASVTLMTYRTPTGAIASADTTPATVPLGTAGSWAVQVTARDSRGLTRTVEIPVTVAACEAPRITAIDAQRWSSGSAAGHQDEEGTYAQVQAMAQITSLASSAVWTYELGVSGGAAQWTGTLSLDGNGFGYIGGSMSPDSAYTLRVTVTDSLGQSSSASAEIPTGLYTMHILQGGKGVAFGKQAEHYGLEISGDWPIRVEGQHLEEYFMDRLYPVGVLLLSADQDWDPMAQWPWTEWGRLSDVSVDGITMAQWVRGR